MGWEAGIPIWADLIYASEVNDLHSRLSSHTLQIAKTLGAEISIEEVSALHCRVFVPDFIVNFYLSPTGIVHSALQPTVLQNGELNFPENFHTWLILRSRGCDWPQQSGVGSSKGSLDVELERIARCLVLVRDGSTFDEISAWTSGYLEGYFLWDRKQ